MNASEKAKEIFLNATEKTLPAQRQAYLDAACGDDAELRREVEDLLSHHEQLGSFLRAPDRPTPQTIGVPASEQPGTVIGPYKLIEQIGEGGMGTVWMAQQTEPVKRSVALKIIKPGMDSRQVIARFEAERQALTLMDHPNIAKVLDAGTTENGRPYFVMELVKGQPITQYCDEKHRTPRERLELLLPVCHAIQHAHQKGIIHRDIKPTNILVAEYDQQPVPKVIDFGVAKATGSPLSEKTMFTGFGQIVGTLEYMSPEQAKINQLDIDTRSDIYSLGVLLYELLTGSTPLDKQRLRSAAWDEMLRIIREEEPPRPSTKLSSNETLPSVAANRSMEPARLSRTVRGDLDWIVMKCLEKDRNRRYETANGFARDIERYLHHEIVDACPPSSTYRFKKFLRRNRAALATAAAVTIALVTGTVVSTWQAIRATRAEHLAESRLEAETAARAAESEQRKIADRQRREAEKQRAEAEANFQKARQAVDQYFTLVSESTLLNIPGLQPLRRELLEAALRFYRESANQRSDDPDVLANLAVTYIRVAGIFHATDRNDDAVAALGQALDAIDRLRREYPSATGAHRKLAGFWKGLRRVTTGTVLPRDREQAFHMLQRFAETWERLAEEHPAVVEFQNDLAAIDLHIGALLNSAGQRSAAIPFVLKAQAIWERLVREHPSVPEYKSDLADVLSLLAAGHAAVGRDMEAEELRRRNLELREQLVAQNPKSPKYRSDLAWSLMRAGAYLAKSPQEAESAYRRALAINRALIEEFPAAAMYREDLVDQLSTFAEYLASTGRTEEGLSVLRDNVVLIGPSGTITHATPNFREQLARFYRVFGIMLRQSGRAAEAAKAVTESCEFYKKLAIEIPNESKYRLYLADNYIRLINAALAQSDHALAEATLRDAIQSFGELATAHASMPEHRRMVALFQARLARLQIKTGRTEEANQTLQHAIDLHQKIIEEFPQYGDLGLVYLGLARLLSHANQRDQAEAALKKGTELKIDALALNNIAWELATGPEPRFHEPRWAVELAQKANELAPESKVIFNTLGAAHYRTGDWNAAIVSLKQSMELRKGGDSFDWFFLAMAEWQLGNKDAAHQWYEKAVKWMDKNATTHSELVRFRAEAAELLGIDSTHKGTE
jgi:serine/threonine protein kinase/tetratricopeptide (TPR) repeat protein